MTMTAPRKSEHFARPMPIRMKSSSRVTAYKTASKGRQERGLKSRTVVLPVVCRYMVGAIGQETLVSTAQNSS